MSLRFPSLALVARLSRLRLVSRAALLATGFGLAGCASATLTPATMLQGPSFGEGSRLDVMPLAQAARPLSVVDVTPDNIAQFGGGGGAGAGGQGWVYRLGVGDVMQLFVVDEPELTQTAGYRVAEDGAIQVPYLGRVPVDGRSVAEIRADLVTRLSRYRSSPQVDVRVTDFNARSVAVVGDVRRPSRQGLTDRPLTAIDAINAAGGFAQDPARADVMLIRGGAEQRVDVQAFLSQGTATPVLRDGDVLRVGTGRLSGRASMPQPSARVHRPGRRAERIALDRGPVSVMQIARAPIAPPGADVVVLRPGSLGVQALRLDAIAAQSPVMGGVFQLRDGDVVTFASASPADPDLVMSQISPALRLLDRR